MRIEMREWFGFAHQEKKKKNNMDWGKLSL